MQLLFKELDGQNNQLDFERNVYPVPDSGIIVELYFILVVAVCTRRMHVLVHIKQFREFLFLTIISSSLKGLQSESRRRIATTVSHDRRSHSLIAFK